MDNPSLLHIASKFNIQGNPITAKEFGSGHINDTYRICTDNSEEPDYLLQRINHHVFKNVDVLMKNIQIVTEHLKDKIRGLGSENVDKKVLTLIPTIDNQLYFLDDQKNYWRTFILIDQTKSYDIVENDSQAKEGGKAFGEFQSQLADLDSSKINYTIPDFCNIEFRLKNFHAALETDVVLRKASVQEEIDYILQRENKMNTILQMGARGELPLRITHNDTKFNNVLLDENDKAQCVIDLDTVMPGFVAYDFGDAIRTIINRAAEDEADLSKITLNIPLFKAYTEGYLEAAKQFITQKEIESLLEGALLFPYMQAVRFLTDYLEGDTYYKIHHDQHNLQRTRAQLKLAFEVESHQEELKNIINTTAANYSISTQCIN